MSFVVKHSRGYAILGVLMGLSAPVGWTLIRLIFFADHNQSFMEQVFFDVVKDAKTFVFIPIWGLVHQ